MLAVGTSFLFQGMLSFLQAGLLNRILPAIVMDFALPAEFPIPVGSTYGLSEGLF
jgi:hypothetical protein